MSECNEIRESLVLHAEGLLDPAFAARVRTHIDTCAACRAEYEDLSRVTGWLREPALFAPPEDYAWQLLPQTLAARARSVPAAPRWVPTNIGRASWILGVAATLVLACGGLWIAYRSLQVKQLAPAVQAPLEAPGNQRFLEKIQDAYARQVTARYLEECRDLLLNVVHAEPTCPDEKLDLSVEVAQARELLRRKRLIESELQRPEVARARELCDELETLLVGLSSADRCETRDRLQHMERLMERQRLLLRINVVQAELS